MSNQSEPQTIYRFRDFALDTGRGALFRQESAVKLRPQSYEVLKLLISNHGRLLTKEEIHNEIWGNKAVTDDSLAQCLIDIRRAFGDNDRTIIRTVPRRGYVFDGEVFADEPTQDPDVVHAHWWSTRKRVLAAIGALAIVVLIWQAVIVHREGQRQSIAPSIAVMPFIDMSATQDQQYLGDGLSEDLLNALAQNSSLRVIARTSSFAFAEQSRDIAAIRNALDVEYVLEGSVRRDRDSLRITAQLIDTSDSAHVWSQSFDPSIGDLPAVQQFIAEQIQRHILPNSEPVNVAPPKHNVSADELIRLARFYENEVRELPEVDEAKLQKAIDLYREATMANPDSALAHSRLARALLYAGEVATAEASVFRALNLGSDLSEVQETVGRFYWARNMPEAGAAWRRAIELNPNNVEALSSYAYWRWIRVDTTISETYFRRALDLDPFSLSRYADLGYFLGNEAQIDAVLALIERVEQLFHSAESYRLIAQLLNLIGRTDESIAWTIRARDLEPNQKLHSAALAELYADIGDFETALKLEPEPGLGLLLKLGRYDKFIDIAEFRMIEEPSDIYLRYLLAYAYNVTGRHDDAVRILRNAGVIGDWRNNARQMIDIEAAMTLADSTHASGDVQLGRELAESWNNVRHTKSPNWWIHLYSSCAFAILDRDAAALDELDRIRQSPRLPWRHLIRDTRCFRKFAGEPRFVAILDHVDERLKEVRERLPDTLERFGVELGER